MSDKVFDGDCFNNRLAGEDGIAKLVNITKVEDYRCPGDDDYEAGGIPPYPRLVCDTPGGGGDCPGPSTNCIFKEGEAGPGSDDCGIRDCEAEELREPFCAPWTLEDRVENMFEEAGTLNLASCRKFGFKNVQALRRFLGRFGFLSHDPGGQFISGPSYDCGCLDPGYEAEQPSPDQTKYLSVSASSSGQYKYPTFEDTFRSLGSIEAAMTGTQYGNATHTCDSEPGKDLDDVDTPIDSDVIDGIGAAQSWSPQTINAEWYRLLTLVSNMLNLAGGAPALATLTFGAGFSVTWDYTTGGGTHYTGSLESDDSSLDYTNTSVGTGGGTFVQTENISISNTDSSFDKTATRSGYIDLVGPPVNFVFEWHSEAHLTDANTAGSIYEDLKILLGQWSLSDDPRYPWREDSLVTVAPLVTRNKAGTLSVFAVRPDVDDNCADDVTGYDGAIKGGPLSTGYQGSFDYDHKTYKICDDGLVRRWYVFSEGAVSGPTPAGWVASNDVQDSLMPGTATQWTDNYMATFLRPGAWVKYWGASDVDDTDEDNRQPFGSCCMAQKWAEIRVVSPHFDEQRPCGNDKYFLDEALVRCVESYEEVAGKYRVTLAEAVTVNYKCVVCGVDPLLNGIWIVTLVSDTVYELTTLVEAGPAFENCGTGIFAKLRFPDAAACDGSDTTPRGKYVYATWQHNFRDYQERNRAIAQYGTVTDPGPPPTGEGCIQCSGSEPPSFDLIRQYQQSWGMPQSVAAITLDNPSLAFTACAPVVMAISPNESDTWTNGTRHDFPADFASDERYGALWQAEIRQHDQDYLWQEPHAPCVECDGDFQPSACPMVEDDGLCPADLCLDDCEPADGSGIYYPQRPWVEAQLGDLQDGKHFLDLDDLDTPSEPSGQVFPPAEAVGYDFQTGTIQQPRVTPTPWMIYENERDCVCATGRFSTEYAENNVIC